ncbi:MAG: DUF366 family protein [Bdellovibrionaceae bacterium]|nr:DUF366 family protein [Pseudobdellovibrionaceae bacterium]MBX3033881.1 DUF366 family protein [Pseudobdellovibrionaceae bacterium]
MKTLWIEKNFPYDGTQLRSLYAYLDHGLLGDSTVAWEGACRIDFAHMVDGEDLLQKAEIRGGGMLHFIIEIFDRDLFAGVCVQRLMASLAKDLLQEHGAGQPWARELRRDGDDIYWGGKKLSISIATRSPVSTLVHFAMNVVNAGTPVATCALRDDFGLDPKPFAAELLQRLSAEYDSIFTATRKVRPVP